MEKEESLEDEIHKGGERRLEKNLSKVDTRDVGRAGKPISVRVYGGCQAPK